MSTIYALASGGPPCGVAVVRISGPRCRFVLETMIGSVPKPRTASLRSIRDRSGSVLDRGLVLWLPGPGSFTGEDTIEFQVHGSRAVVRALASALGEFEGLRPAEAGEFTRRAFATGRIDLTEAEGLADLVAAETEAQRRQALAQSDGGLRRLYEGWREQLLWARALIEADLDFADEEDIPGSVVDQAMDTAAGLADAIAAHFDDAHRGERVRTGLQVVILGPPNAGKSSLLNALARRDVAIVTAEAGTTRDLLEVHLDLNGYPVTLVDTAGLRATEGVVEREGIRRALERGLRADLVVWAQAPDLDDPGVMPVVDCPVWRVDGKCDLGTTSADTHRGPVFERGFRLSAETGVGLDELVQALGDFAADRMVPMSGLGPTRERHRAFLRRTVDDVREAIRLRNEPELAADRLRSAGDQLGRITGRIDVEDVLDSLFGSFCIGK